MTISLCQKRPLSKVITVPMPNICSVDASAIIQRFDEIYANDTGLLPNHALNNSPIKIMGKLPGSKRDRNRKWLKPYRHCDCCFVADLVVHWWHDSELDVC